MTTQLLSRWLSIMIGPELLWLLVYGAISLLAKANLPASLLVSDLIKSLSIVIPGIAALLFLLWYVPSLEKRWLLPRMWVAGLIGAHTTLTKGMSIYSEQGLGVGTFYLAGMVLVIFVLIVGSLFVQLRFRSRSS